VAARLTGPVGDWMPVLLAALAAFLIAGAANTLNDIIDLPIDRVNRPDRPLPAGQLSLPTARVFSLVAYLGGIALSFAVSRPLGWMATFFAGLTALYSLFLKKTALWGNLVVSLSTAAVFVFGGLALGRPEKTLWPAIFAFFMHLAREIIKDMEDVRGDALAGAQTLPIRFGMKSAARFTIAALIIMMGLTLLPYLNGVYGRAYLTTLLVGVFPVLIFIAVTLGRQGENADFSRLSNLLKVDMLVGLLAIFLG
ncbi:MAG TPA: geranylgeranylglycerol-phosphate geranylgeranyltransferase, partial [Calditrichia bacterium]|nr:geranylgeranylglycerol-phosphate geranylgeranyltransferase [Calditrichia bacterium]